MRRFGIRLTVWLALAATVATVGVVPGIAAGARLAVGNQKVLIESDHFGSYYLPEVHSIGKSVYAFWRGPGQPGTQRTVKVSKDGGKTFKKQKVVKTPLIAQIFAIGADPAGYFYIVGPTVFANQLAVLRSDKKLKNFTTLAVFDTVQNAVNVDITVSANGTLYLAYQTAYVLRFRNGSTASTEQTFVATSIDHGTTFSPFTPTNEDPVDFADADPVFIEGASSQMYIAYVRSNTLERAAAGDSYMGSQVEVRNLTDAEAPLIDFPKSALSTGNPNLVQGFVGLDGALCVAWSEPIQSSETRAESVYFATAPVGSVPEAPVAPLATVGNAYRFQLARTGTGTVVVLLHGAGIDSNADEPAIIGLASNDDGQTFGPVVQITTYPPVTTLRAATDGQSVFGIWTDTRQVVLATFQANQ